MNDMDENELIKKIEKNREIKSKQFENKTFDEKDLEKADKIAKELGIDIVEVDYDSDN